MSRIYRKSLAICVFSTITGTLYAGPVPTSNDCSDVGWADTLRCQALTVTGSAAKPQKNWNETPATNNDIKDYTRVFLADNPHLRCYDGTYPVIYVDAAICTDPAGCAGGVSYGADLASDKWIFSMTGGGACVPEEGAIAGVIDDATDCTNRYDGEAAEMGTSGEPPMKYLGSEPGGSNGIHSADPVINPVFAGYNRVRIEKCGFDRYNGRAEFPAVNGTLAGVPVTYDAYQLGWGMMVATLKELLSGLNYTTWSWSGGAPTDIVENTTATLPPLSDAETILFVGHSGAAHGLMHNVDALVEKLAGLGVNPAVDVRALFDANFTGSPENEAAFADDLSTGAPLNGHLFSNHTMGESIAGGAVGGSPYTYDMAAYYSDPNTALVKQYDNWQAAFDASCLGVHSGPDAYLCRDRKHVLLNHVSTPFFIREDFTDPNKEHTAGGLGHPVQWGEWQTDPALCGWFGGAPCPPLLTIAEHRERLEAQAQAVIDHYWTDSEMGAADTSLGTDSPTVYLWMPDCTRHAGAYANDTFFDTTMTYKTNTYSMRTWLEGFMRVPPYNRKGWRVDGWSDLAGGTMTTTCP